ncbi:sialidase family protein [Streptomyces sp. NPDC006551]|uniref:sialidase family protein n=1 Tax=Streptomyces sp. NPDC006551 TaxID=3157178 RepID=UPI0033A11907
MNRTRLLAALLSFASLAGLATASPAAAGGTELSSSAALGTQQVLFRSGTAGYGCFRIPTLVTTKTGALLAFAEGRTSPSCADRGPIDIVMRRSTNDGRTWSPIRVVSSGSETDAEAPHVRGNPSPVADRDGDVFLFSNSEKATPGDVRRSWFQRSSDDGITFGAPLPAPRLTESGKGWFGTGPSHGIQLHDGPHAGRLIVGAYETVSGTPGAEDQRAGVLYSDDHGDTWQASKTVNSFLRAEDLADPPPNTKPEDPMFKPGEPVVAELPGGDVHLSARSPYDIAGHRMHTVSTDDGATVPVFGPTKNWKGPDVQVSVLAPRRTYRQTPGDLLLMSTPSHETLRQGMRIRYSLDKGVNWIDAPGGQVSKVLADRAGYSDMAEMAKGEFGLVYEGGTVFSAQHIYFNRFTAGELGLPASVTSKGSALPQPTPAPGRTTPDVTPEANDAYLGAGATLGAGAVLPATPKPVYFGQGLQLDGVTGHADLPFTPSLDPGAGDVTYSLHFRYEATSTTPQQALFWAYGEGSGTPQVWVRAQPAQNRILAWVQGANGTAWAALTGPDTSKPAFGDGRWHHLTLVRTGETVTLQVDGGNAAPQEGKVVGALAGPRENNVKGLGIRIGDKPVEDEPGKPYDGFKGTIDEFRLYRTALTEEQRGLLRGTRASEVAADRLAAHLPFQVVDTADTAPLTTTRIQDDVSGHCADGTLLGTASTESGDVLVEGRVGKGALGVSPTLPGVEVPYVPAVDNGAGDFTFSLWFRYAATKDTKDAVLMWAYGSTSGAPSLWVRARPSGDRLVARAETTEGSIAVDLLDPREDRVAFGDDAWHLLTVTRSGDRFAVGVDGIVPGAPGAHVVTANGSTGSFTDGVDAPEGIRVGSKPDGSDVLTGRLDDVRYYKRALTEAEVADILDTAPQGWSPPKNPSLWWSMEGGNTEEHLVMRPAVDAATRATPDASQHCGHAYVRGGAALSPTGAFGRGLAFDGTDDAVELPYGDAKALGGSDFTLATWVRYTAADNETPVLAWAYGVGSAERQLWIRAVPEENKVIALLQTDTATTTVEVRAPAGTVFGDDTWRHVVLRRQAGTLTLSVDGAAADGGTSARATATAPAGSLTYGDSFSVRGFQLGARPDGTTTDRLQGAMDDFFLARRALSDTELTTLRSTADSFATDTAVVVRLPFDTLTPKGSYARM